MYRTCHGSAVACAQLRVPAAAALKACGGVLCASAAASERGGTAHLLGCEVPNN
jgi:hypothetical protein